MSELPTGTVTFLFTDLEGSTRLWEQHPDAMRDALARHDEILHTAVEAQDGVVFSEMGDGMAAAFPSAPCALHACLNAQLALLGEPWGDTPLKARMGLHAGDGTLRADGQYVNAPLNRCARLMAVAHGGQVVLSDAIEVLVRDVLPPDTSLLDLGEHRLRDLANPMHVFQLAHPQLPREFPRLKSLGRDTNLPVQLTTFIGREREIEELSAALAESRIVTLTGVGGVGKTRLALQVAAEALPQFPDGAWLAELAAVSDPDAIPDTIATALDIPGTAGQGIEATLVEDLRRRSLLLVVDNCEHVLDRIAHLAGEIVRNCPGVVVLATSREGLALPGERIYAVPSLPVPAEHASLDTLRESDAVQLFVDRAASVRGDFDLTAENADGVVAICRRLDGVPLALELAAARVTTLHPAQIAQRLDERFRILTAGRRTAVERHQTLRATIDWSYDLLGPDEQIALNRLAVFAGGCTLGASEAVLAGDDLDAFDVLELLGRLVEQSLVIATDAGAERRYRLLETIRQYAAERLADAQDTEATLRRHAEYYRALAAEIGPGLRGPDERPWLAVYETELENLRTAVTWFADADDADAAFGIVFDLYALVFFESSQSIIELATIAGTAPSAATHPLGPSAMTLTAEHVIQSDPLAEGQHLIDAATAAQSELATPPHPVMLFSQFRVAMLLGDWEACARCLEPLLNRSDVLDDDFLHAWLLNAAGAVAVLDSRPDDAAPMLHHAVALARRTGNPAAIGMTAAAAGWTVRDDDPDTALALFDEVVEVGRSMSGLATSLAYANRAILQARAGRPREAVLDGRAAVAVVERDLERNTFGGAIAHLSIALAELGRFEGAATLFGGATVLIPIATNEAFGWQRIEGKVVDALGRDRFDAAFARGTHLDRDGALALLRAELDAVEAELAKND